MNNTQTNQFLQLLWSKEASAFLMATLQWNVTELETRLKSPYPLIFPLPIQPNDCNKPVDLPNRQPIDKAANETRATVQNYKRKH